jgi:hypothetical protein
MLNRNVIAPAHRGFDTHHGKVARRDELPEHDLRAIAGLHANGKEEVREHAVEHAGAVAHIAKVEVRRVVVAIAVLEPRQDGHEPPGLTRRQRPIQEVIRIAEGDDAGADPEGERQHRGGRETGVLEEQGPAESQVLHQAVHDRLRRSLSSKIAAATGHQSNRAECRPGAALQVVGLFGCGTTRSHAATVP